MSHKQGVHISAVATEGKGNYPRKVLSPYIILDYFRTWIGISSVP